MKLHLSQVKSCFQVLLVAPGLDQREINQLWSERTQDGQEGLSTSPAPFKVLHVDGATDPGEKRAQGISQKQNNQVSTFTINAKTNTFGTGP